MKLGALVSIGLILFILAIYYLGSKQRLFSSSITLNSYFPHVKGLVEGNRVHYAGINVGSVDEIKLVSDSSILVVMLIDKKMKDFIRKDSKVEIGQEGLMGNKIVNIIPGSSSAARVESGDALEYIQSVDYDEIVKQAQDIVDKGGKTAENLLAISQKLNSGKGDLAVLLNDNSLTKSLGRTTKKLELVVDDVASITTKINEGKGDLGRLINDTVLSQNLLVALGRLDDITANTDTFASQLSKFGNALNNGNGLVSKLVYDTTMAGNIDTTLILVNAGVADLITTSQAIRDSWLLNLFSGRKKTNPESGN